MTSAVHLILTVDYEIFGNGLGGVDRCVIDPAERIAQLAEHCDAPVTFFVETLEFLAMENEPATAAYSDAVISQLQSLLRRGHDAQLHLHPQFENASWNGVSWQVSESWRMGELDADGVTSLLKIGKGWLEKILQSQKPEYRCTVFRAGGWCIQPSGVVLESLNQEGFKIDSTVAKGYVNLVEREWAKFWSTPEMPFWSVSDDVCRQGNSELLELPIATGKIGKWRHYSAVQRAKQYGDSGLSPGCVGDYSVAIDDNIDHLRAMVDKVLRLGHVMLDFSTMPAEVLIEITRQWIARFEGTYTSVPVVAIAHTKNFTPESERHLLDYLAWAQSEGIWLSTYSQWIESLCE